MTTLLMPEAAAGAAATGVTGARLIIDSQAIAANTRLFTARTHGTVMAVVKADGFGHGARLVAAAALANGATWLGVTGVAEALALRQAGLPAPILSWLNPVDADFGDALECDVDIAVPSLEHLAAVAAAATCTGRRARVHLHVDCGMARDGAPAWRWRELCERARARQREDLISVVGVMGHLGCADDAADPCNSRGRARFAWAVRAARESGLRPVHRHLAATAATLTDRRAHHTMSRIGAGSSASGRPGQVTATGPTLGRRPMRARRGYGSP